MVGSVRVGSHPGKEIRVAELLGSHTQETFVIVAFHTDIDVVVPRQYGLVVQCANSRSAYDEIGYVMFGTDAHDLGQYLVQNLVQLLQLLRCVYCLGIMGNIIYSDGTVFSSGFRNDGAAGARKRK